MIVKNFLAINFNIFPINTNKTFSFFQLIHSSNRAGPHVKLVSLPGPSENGATISLHRCAMTCGATQFSLKKLTQFPLSWRSAFSSSSRCWPTRFTRLFRLTWSRSQATLWPVAMKMTLALLVHRHREPLSPLKSQTQRTAQRIIGRWKSCGESLEFLVAFLGFLIS